LRNCVSGISGVSSESTIDAGLCTRCGMCQSVCKFDAILVQ
jgi:MinD superfamily P-loop ATPase